MDATHRAGPVACGLLTVLIAAGAGPACAQSAEQQPGSWQSHKLTLYLLSISTLYSCQGMKDSLTYLLQQVGARIDKPVVPQPCVNGYSTPERLSQAQLEFASLQPAGGGQGSGQTVVGSWRHVQLSPQHTVSLHGADCDLVKTFRDQILPLFATRNISARLSCPSFQDTSRVYSLSFDVFAPMNAPAAVGMIPGRRATQPRASAHG